MKNKTSRAGYTLLESTVAMGIIAVMASVALPSISGYRQEAALLGAAESFKDQFMKARSIATMKNVETAIRFETGPSGIPMFSTYIDGNSNGVQSDDIRRGLDTRIAGPFRLDAGQPGVDVGVLYDAPSPEGGKLGDDPIRFGRSNMVSFSEIGTGTPGTFYLRTRSSMAGVRVTGGSARVRIMILRGKRWIDRQG